MKILRLFLLLASSLSPLAAHPAFAVQVTLESPDQAQTFIYGDMTGRKLGWQANKKLFYAELNFSNERYAGYGEKIERESFRFNFPGVNYDEKTKTFFVLTNTGRMIPVAQVVPQFIGSAILPVHTTMIRVRRFRGDVHVTLEIDTERKVSAPAGTTTNELRTIPLKDALGP